MIRMTSLTDLTQIWTDQESTSGKNVVKKQIDSIPALNCYIGLIGGTGARMFQLEMNITKSVHENFLRKFRGVEIQAIPLSNFKTEYTIILLDKELTEIFTMFIDDIIEKLSQVTESQQALTIINQRVNHWKMLFSRASGELLSFEKQRGLFGELYFLRLLLQNSSNYYEIIQSWRGAESSNQDFAKEKIAVEIKTTKANNLSVYISNEQQLDYTAWENLFLGLFSVTETTGRLNSLTGIIDEIKGLFNHDLELVREFETRLENAGVSREMIENYNDISYSVNNMKFFHIQDGFPVILRGNLQNDSIYNVKYQIDLSSCSSFEIPEEAVFKFFI